MVRLTHGCVRWASACDAGVSHTMVNRHAFGEPAARALGLLSLIRLCYDPIAVRRRAGRGPCRIFDMRIDPNHPAYGGHHDDP